MMKLGNFRYYAGTIGLASLIALPVHAQESLTSNLEVTPRIVSSTQKEDNLGIDTRDFDFQTYLQNLTKEEVEKFEKRILKEQNAYYGEYELRFDPNDKKNAQEKIDAFANYLSRLEKSGEAASFSESYFLDLITERRKLCQEREEEENQNEEILHQLAVGYYINLNCDSLDEKTLMSLNREYHFLETENPTKMEILYQATNHYIFFDVDELKDMIANEQDVKAFALIQERKNQKTKFSLPDTFEKRCEDLSLSSIVLKSLDTSLRGSGFSCHRHLLQTLVQEYRDSLEEETIEFVGIDINEVLGVVENPLDVAVFYGQANEENQALVMRKEFQSKETPTKRI